MKTTQNHTITLKKKKFLNALMSNGFNISSACRENDVGRKTYYDWLDSDKEFKDGVEEAQEKLIDDAEKALQEKITDGDTTSIIFFLKTKGKKRGYIEKQETEISGSLAIKNFEDFYGKS